MVCNENDGRGIMEVFHKIIKKVLSGKNITDIFKIDCQGENMNEEKKDETLEKMKQESDEIKKNNETTDSKEKADKPAGGCCGSCS